MPNMSPPGTHFSASPWSSSTRRIWWTVVPFLCITWMASITTVNAANDGARAAEASYNITSAVTPDVALLGNVFASAVSEEMPDDDYVVAVSQFEWEKALNVSTASPFLVCATGGREGVRQLTTEFGLSMTLPMFSNGTLSCYAVYSQAPDVINKTVDIAQIQYATPIPSILKVSKALVDEIDSGALFTTSASSGISLRIVLPPSLESQTNLVNVIRRLIRAIRTGRYANRVAEDFVWSAASSPFSPPSSSSSSGQAREGAFGLSQTAHAKALRARLFGNNDESKAAVVTGTRRPTTRGNAGGGGQASSQDHGPPSDREPGGRGPLGLPPRSNKWLRWVNPVLNGSIRCNFDGLVATAQKPYIRLSGVESFVTGKEPRACLITMLAYLVSDPAVFFIEAYPKLEAFNQVASYIVQSAVKDSYPMYNAGLNGTDQIVQVADTGLDQNSCFFSDSTGPVTPTTYQMASFDLTKRKVVQYVAWTDTTDEAKGHGTHVSGTAVGMCADSTLGMDSYAGIASGAKIAFYDMGDVNGTLSAPANLNAKLFPPGYTAGARIFSNSWGSTRTTYTYLDTEMDKFMYANDDVLILVAAGNDGALGFSKVYSPALSKNVIAVGAGENERNPAPFDESNVAWFSSRGPTLDGRIKPDVIAPGRRLLSAMSGAACDFLSMQGTSMSTPVVAGSAAIVRQYFMQGYYPTGSPVAANSFIPTGAMLKAALINSAVPMLAYRFSNGTMRTLGSPPDPFQGHGRIKLDELLNIEGSVNLWLLNNESITERSTDVYKFAIPWVASSYKPFKITLVWIDPDTTSSSATVVLHNLDLLVKSASTGLTLYPNGLSAPDSKNTVEKVVIYSPTPGDVLTVSVAGTSISTRRQQNYALVASGTFMQATWFCQSPLLTRLDTLWKTEYCSLSCFLGTFSKSPRCCVATAGNDCSTSEIASDESACDARAKPWDCVSPTPAPTKGPTRNPTRRPTRNPTRRPSASPSRVPTAGPTFRPSRIPTAAPTQRPSRVPTSRPTRRPSAVPTTFPTRSPTNLPSNRPTRSPTNLPSKRPTSIPTTMPTVSPTMIPTTGPPTATPSTRPTRAPSAVPTRRPSKVPTPAPSRRPTAIPTQLPSRRPSRQPTLAPSVLPTSEPTPVPTSPTSSPSLGPSRLPTSGPSRRPTRAPSPRPSRVPTRRPTGSPSTRPTSPTSGPSKRPSPMPTPPPTRRPTRSPTRPTQRPT